MLRQFRMALFAGAALPMAMAHPAFAQDKGSVISPYNPNIILSNQDRTELARARASFYWRPVAYGQHNGVPLQNHTVIWGGMPGSDHLDPYYNYYE